MRVQWGMQFDHWKSCERFLAVQEEKWFWVPWLLQAKECSLFKLLSKYGILHSWKRVPLQFRGTWLTNCTFWAFLAKLFRMIQLNSKLQCISFVAPKNSKTLRTFGQSQTATTICYYFAYSSRQPRQNWQEAKYHLTGLMPLFAKLTYPKWAKTDHWNKKSFEVSLRAR